MVSPVFIFATFWLFTGVFGVSLALRLGVLAAEDRGALRVARMNGAYALINRKMLREASLRLLTAVFAIFVAVVIFLTIPFHPYRPMTPAGVAISLGLTLVTVTNVAASWLDLVDRDRLAKLEGVLRRDTT